MYMLCSSLQAKRTKYVHKLFASAREVQEDGRYGLTLAFTFWRDELGYWGIDWDSTRAPAATVPVARSPIG